MKPEKMILGLIPNNKCNLKCGYCYISQLPNEARSGGKFLYDVAHMAQGLSVERLGGVCLINLTGEGETMLQPDIVRLCELLLAQGHYIELVTNLTVTKVVDEFMALPTALLSQMEFKISFHYHELLRLKLMDKFFDNVRKVQQSACSFTLELMPTDELIGDIDAIIALCDQQVGAKCHVTVGRADYLPSRSLLTSLSREEYVKTWSVFESPMFDLKMKLLDVKRKEFCYAGAWTLYVNMYTGDAAACYSQPFTQNVFKDLQKPIRFAPVGYHCTEPYCINGHAHISLGVIPGFDSPTYAMIRNRQRADGTEWFSENGKEFFSGKFIDRHSAYTSAQKAGNTVLWYGRSLLFLLKNPGKVWRRVKLIFLKNRKAKEEKGKQDALRS